MAVGSVTLVGVKGFYGEQPVVITSAYETLTSFGSRELELEGLIDALEEVYFNKTVASDLLNLCHPIMTFTGISLRDATDKTVGLDHVLDPFRVGNLTGEQPINSTCMLVMKKTSRIGRSYTGRNYLPVGSETMVVAGIWDTGFMSAVQDWKVLTRDIYNVTLNFTFREVVWSKTLAVATAIKSYAPIIEPRIQRRRRRT